MLLFFKIIFILRMFIFFLVEIFIFYLLFDRVSWLYELSEFFIFNSLEIVFIII